MKIKMCNGKRHYPIKNRSCSANDMFLSSGRLECGNCGAIFLDELSV